MNLFTTYSALSALILVTVLSADVPHLNECLANPVAQHSSTCAVQLDYGAAASKLTHVVIALIDDLGLNDFYTSSDLAQAWPNVAKLAAQECVALESFYTQSTCTPTRGALMTGRMPIRIGLQHKSIMELQSYGLPLVEETIADKFSNAGYRTIMVGKWHLGAYNNRSLPTRRGFDHHYGFMTSGMHYITHTTVIDGKSVVCLMDDDKVDRRHHGTYSPKLFADKVVSRIEGHAHRYKDQPLFLYYSLQNTHSPLIALEEYTNTTACMDVPNPERKLYCGLALSADEGIGQMDAALKKWFSRDDVLVVIAGDNGGQVDHAGNQCSHFGDPKCLRGSKGRVYEGGIRNNALFCSKTLVPNRRRGKTYSKGMGHIMDVHATVLAVAGIGSGSQTDEKPLDGMNLWDAVMKDTPSPRTEFLVNLDPCNALGPFEEGCVGQTAAYRYNGCLGELGDHCAEWKLVQGEWNSPWCQVPHGPEMECWEVQQWADNETFLFNLTADAGERFDLKFDFPYITYQILEKIAIASRDMVEACNVIGGSCEADDPAALETTTQALAYVPWAP